MRNLRLVIAYDGTDFHGWQRQPNVPTVQSLLEGTIREVIDEPVVLYGSGRTDAGAHASGQVANFKTSCRIPCSNLQGALNRALPPSVRVRAADEVPEQFHARYDARSKTYRYRILEATVCPPFLWRFVHHLGQPLDREIMARAAKKFEGEHDFTSFAASEAGGPATAEQESKVRTIFRSKVFWKPRTRLLTYEVCGNGFLHHMVRNIVGTMIQVARGERAEEDLIRILDARNRTLTGPTAPARGLCLVRVEY